MRITPVYAALLAIALVVLSWRVIRLRRKHKTSLGDGGKMELLRAIGVQANFSEYTPIFLILLALAELTDVAPWALHLWGVAFCAGRISHAYGVSQLEEPFQFRIGGMITTFTVLVTCAVTLLARSL